MRLILSLSVVIAVLFSPIAKAKIVGDALPSSARAGVDLYYMAQASYDRDDRLAYTFSYNWALLPNLRIDNFFTYAPDESAGTEVKFSEDLYILAPTVTVTYPLLFRFAATAGPAFIMTKSHLSFRGENKTNQVSQIGSKLAFNTEYAIADCCEVVATIGLVLRHQDSKMDWSYGLAYSQNIGPVSSPESSVPKSKNLSRGAK